MHHLPVGDSHASLQRPTGCARGGERPETQEDAEKTLVEEYYQSLRMQGVFGYSLEQCWNDFKLSIMFWPMFMSIWFGSQVRHPPSIKTRLEIIRSARDIGRERRRTRINGRRGQSLDESCPMPVGPNWSLPAQHAAANDSTGRFFSTFLQLTHRP